MPYTDLSYYKLSVHLQIRLVWPETLQAPKLSPPAFCPLSKLFKFTFPVFFRKAGRVL